MMHPFAYRPAHDEGDALSAGAAPGARYLAGGTTLIDLMRLRVESPDTVVDVGGLPYGAVDDHDGGLRIGALVKNSDLAFDARVVERYPVLSQALLSGASPQVRNMATTAGNLLQRTRCPYFRDASMPCNKRRPGSGCGALGGWDRGQAILGASAHCIATHPSDMAVALVALDAVVQLRGKEGARSVPLRAFHTEPGDRPDVETVMRPGELITHVDVPALPLARRSVYVKVRDRASFDFALASAAVALDVQDDTIRQARVALGGVGTKPWRASGAEDALVGKRAGAAAFAAAAEAALAGARPQKHNGFKIELAKRTVVRALERASGTA